MLNSEELREIVVSDQENDNQLEGMTKTKMLLDTNDDFNAKKEEENRYESPPSSFVRVREFDPDKMMESSPAPASKPPMTSSKCVSEAKLPEPASFQILQPMNYEGNKRTGKLESSQT